MPNPLLARFDGKPVLVDPEMQSRFDTCLTEAAKILAKVEDRIANDDRGPMAGLIDDFWPEPGDYRARYRPYNVKDGILQIPVKGVLMHDFPYQFGTMGTGYDYIRRAYDRGMDDSNVKGIALVIDSPGGEVAGNFDLVDHMYSRRDEKPVRAYAMEDAFSAAYSIASVANDITVSRTGAVGSIGVVTAHMDMSKALEERGMKVTLIHFGKHKVDGNRFNPLPDDVKARVQERIDTLGEVFVSTVARNRGMSEDAVRGTEAATFTAAQAVSNGLADKIGALDDAIAAFAADLSLEDEDETMTEEEKKAFALANREEGVSEGKAQGAADERARITSIIASDEGKKRPTMAMKLATGDKFAALDADTVIEMLADMPEEKAEAPAPKKEVNGDAPKGKDGAAADFASAMANAEHPNAGAPTEMTDDQKRAQRRQAAAAAAGRAKATGK